MRVALLGIVAVAVGGAAAFGMSSLRGGTPRAQAVSGDSPAPTFGNQGTIAAVAPETHTLRALDHAHPLRLWVGGDSLAGSFGPALGDLVGATGVAQTTVDYKVSSGLWSNDIRNWYQRATDQMTSANPDAVVFIIGTNDTPAVNNYDGNGDGVPDWQVDYRQKVDRMMDLFVGAQHRTVFWLGAPTLADSTMDRGAVAVDQVMREEAAKRAPDVVYVDTYKLFSGPDGTYSRHILDEKGNEIAARIGDGVHFTEDGASYLARAVFSLLDTRWHLSAQADTAQPIGWSLASGSGENVPGLSSQPHSRYRSYHHYTSTPSTDSASNVTITSPPATLGGGTVTSVVVTAPPVTSPPATTPPPPSTSPHVTSPPPPTTKKP